MSKRQALVMSNAAHQPDVTVPLAKNAITVLERRYLTKDETGKVVETPDEMFHRVARNLAEAEGRYGGDVVAWEERFYTLMRSLEFLPNSPTLMNAGRPLQQLSACFVLPVPDDLGDIFATIRNQAIIHQSGGGCIAGDARVWTTFCGIEPLEVLFNRAIADGRPGIQHGMGTAYAVDDLGIRTVSMDPATGTTDLRPVTHVWRFDVPAAHQVVVSTREGTEIQTSDWHPFMVVRGTSLVEARADELVSGDVVLGPERPDAFWPWQEPRRVGSLTIDPDLGWLIGFTLGDGSFGYVPALRQYRVRWFSGTTDVLERARLVLARHGIQVKIQQDARGLFSIATLTQRFVHDLLEACGLEKFGPKDDLIRVPEVIAKSPLPVVRAFLAGLLDSDGYVAADGSPSYTSASEAMAQDLAALLSLLGYQPAVRAKAPYGKGRLVTHTVQLCPLPQVNELAADLAPYLSNNLRLERLGSASRKQRALHLPIAPWREHLKALGLVKERGAKLGGPGPCAFELNRWSHSELSRVRRDSLHSIAVAAAPHDPVLAQLLRRIAASGQEVASVVRAAETKPFYDLTVEGWNTYAAGRSGLAMVHNTGFGFSRLRPKNDIVMTTKGKASGPISFMQVFDAATGAIKQGGTRRGANMAILSVDHPDIEEFVEMKNDLSVMTNFNVSVALTEQFMAEVERDEEHALVNPRTGAVVRRVSARRLFDQIVHSAWQTGEPGIVFIDRINNSRSNPTPQLGLIESTNPCGEQPLLPYEACNLGSINVGRLTIERDGTPELDWDALREVVHGSTRALEDVIEMNRYPIPEIQEMTTRNRRIGVGLMGWADLLFKLRIPYNSEGAIALAERMMQFIDDEAKNASEQLAAERGPFANWEESIYGPQGQHWPNAQGVRPLRNSTVTTIAPTGTISIIAGASGGIEPLFSLAFMRTIMDKDRMLEVNEIFEQVAQAEGFYSAELMEEVAAAGTLADIPGIPDWVKRVFVTAKDISPEWHARMQAAFQKHTDNAVSKCLAAGTLIPTSQGLVPVESFSDVEEPDTFIRLDGAPILTGGHRILSHYYAGEKPATRIRLDNGATLTGATESHRVLTPGGWKLMAELRVGDQVLGRLEAAHTAGGQRLPVPDPPTNNANAVRIPERMNPALATFLGMIAADGHLSVSTGAVGLTSVSETVQETFRALAIELFDVAPRLWTDPRNGVVSQTITSRRLCRWMQGLLGHHAYDKFVPAAILQGSAEEKSAFLRGVSLDGYYVPERGLTVYFGMSERLAYGVAALCQSFGLPLVRQQQKFVSSSGQMAYGVLVSNEMQEQVTPIEPHKNGPAHYTAYQVLIEQEMVTQARLPYDHQYYSGLRSLKQRQPASATSTLATRFGWEKETLVHRVTAIEDAGILPLYDIEVEDAHEYVVNGLISHNTVNVPREATEDEVREVYELAYKLGCKGVTIYRDGSRSEQPMSHVEKKKEAAPAAVPATVPLEVPVAPGNGHNGNGHGVSAAEPVIPEIEAEVREAAQQEPVDGGDPAPVLPRPLPDGDLSGWMGRINSPQGTIRLWVTEVDGQPREAYIILGKSGSDLMAMTEGIGRLLSIALRSGIPMEILIDQLRGIGGSRSVGFGSHRVLSVPDAIAKLLQDHYFGAPAAAPAGAAPARPAGVPLPVRARTLDETRPLGDICPECGNATLMHAEGCKKCACGYSEC